MAVVAEMGVVASAKRIWRKSDLYAILFSIGLHMVVLLVLMAFSLPPPPIAKLISFESALEEVKEEPTLEEVIPQPTTIEEQPAQLDPVNTDVVSDVVGVASAAGDPTADADMTMPSFDTGAVGLLEASNMSGTNKGRGLGDTLAARGTKNAMLGMQGGTRGTERAVRNGLEWMVRHQHPDGHWSADHTQRAKEPSTGKGSAQNDMGSTALGLLPFLAADYTHKKGPHKDVVRRGLAWMVLNQREDGYLLAKGDANGMYNHGLASIVLCEAYGLTSDRSLQLPAKRAVDFIVKTQNKTNGWRYTPNATDADTSVFGWQLMGLKSGVMAGIPVPQETFDRCRRHLKGIAKGKHGGLYPYTTEGPTPAMTAVGVLCLQYLGNKRTEAAIQEGVDYMLKSHGPESSNDPYYWYYATQAIHNYQGPEWDRWNRAIRRRWVERQNANQKSDDYGSWDPKDFGAGHANEVGGRHYVTAVGLLTLEVYYRYLPLYKVQDGEKDGASDPASPTTGGSTEVDSGSKKSGKLSMAKEEAPAKAEKKNAKKSAE